MGKINHNAFVSKEVRLFKLLTDGLEPKIPKGAMLTTHRIPLEIMKRRLRVDCLYVVVTRNDICNAGVLAGFNAGSIKLRTYNPDRKKGTAEIQWPEIVGMYKVVSVGWKLP